ncbi:hypothetical protein F4604DRAFT_1690850 [Suillus subluteus]|nr:hypothetical protein F4604DRAFT_1690850 [Suillus subluteus]
MPSVRVRRNYLNCDVMMDRTVTGYYIKNLSTNEAVLLQELPPSKPNILLRVVRALDLWSNLYRDSLSVTLTDTFPTEVFCQEFDNRRANQWEALLFHLVLGLGRFTTLRRAAGVRNKQQSKALNIVVKLESIDGKWCVKNLNDEIAKVGNVVILSHGNSGEGYVNVPDIGLVDLIDYVSDGTLANENSGLVLPYHSRVFEAQRQCPDGRVLE